MSQRSGSTKAFATVLDVAQAVKDWRCLGCGTKLIPSEGDVSTLSRQWIQRKGNLNSLITCPKCQKLSKCIASCSQNSIKTTTKTGYQVSSCCGAGKLFMMWVLLCGFDHMHVQEKLKLDKSAQKNVRCSRDGGVGYEGFESFSFPWMASQADAAASAGKSKAQAHESKKDSITQMAFELIAALLPSKGRKSDYDENPPPAVIAMLRSSRVLDRIAELLRNDSLEDATHRKHLYQSMLDILRLLGLHSALTDKTIFRKRTFKKDEVSMFALSYYGARKTTNETTSSIAECLMKLNVQSNMMLTGAKNNRSVFDTQQSKDMLWLCRQISDLTVFLLGKEKATAGITPNNQAVNVKETDDDKLLASHFFGQLAARIQNSAPGRMRKIISELTTLKTGLPPGIYIRYGMSRIDVMKVIIVGPEDTPYELGLFEFDILLPTEYPNKPPMVYFRGAAGTLLVSPNLHADGEVCLSILGTFPGEPWNPRESTLLQILVSIQAMILCDEPFTTIPGHSARGTPDSATFNYDVQYLTMRYALLSWLHGRFDPLWSSVVSAHFRTNAGRISRVVGKWMAEGARYANHPPAMRPLDPSVGRMQMAGVRQQAAAQLENMLEAFRQRGGTARIEGRGVGASQGTWEPAWGVQASAMAQHNAAAVRVAFGQMGMRGRGGFGGGGGGFRGDFGGGFGGFQGS